MCAQQSALTELFPFFLRSFRSAAQSQSMYSGLIRIPSRGPRPSVFMPCFYTLYILLFDRHTRGVVRGPLSNGKWSVQEKEGAICDNPLVYFIRLCQLPGAKKSRARKSSLPGAMKRVFSFLNEQHCRLWETAI